MAAVIYIAHHQKSHNRTQLKCNLELKTLNDELASSQNEVDLKREQMKALEQAREERKAMRAEDVELITGLLGTTTGGGTGELLTGEERREWFEHFRMLEADGQLALDEFTEKLSEFL